MLLWGQGRLRSIPFSAATALSSLGPQLQALQWLQTGRTSLLAAEVKTSPLSSKCRLLGVPVTAPLKPEGFGVFEGLLSNSGGGDRARM